MSWDSVRLKTLAAKVWQAAIDAVRPEPLVFQAFSRLPELWRSEFQNAPKILVVGAGKASGAMARGLLQALPECHDRVTGIVNVPGDQPEFVGPICLHPGRPIGSNHPTEQGVVGAEKMLQLLESARPEDMGICLLSGGGSALLPAPAPGISLADKQLVTKLLHGCGATISELNTVRKHLSRIKGGQLATAFRGRRLVSFIISDVVGDPLDVIASGPTVADPTTFEDAYQILQRYYLLDLLPPSVIHHLQSGRMLAISDTPKTMPDTIHNLIVGSNDMALQACCQTVKAEGFNILNLGSMIEGESREVAITLAGLTRAIQADLGPIAKPAMILLGGETTVNLGKNPGRGGRNQEFTLAFLNKMGQAGMAATAVVSLGTDGEDGPTDAAGAIGLPETYSTAVEQGIQPEIYLSHHNAYEFFQRVGGLIRTGLTGTNVMDVRFILVT